MVSPKHVSGSGKGLLDSFSFRRALLAFFLSGILFSFLGAILPLWEHHLKGEPKIIGTYFIALIAGLVLSMPLVRFGLNAGRIKTLLVTGSLLAAAGFLALSAVPLSTSAWWRIPGLLLVGVGGGVLNTGSIRAIFPMFQYAQWSAVNLAGAMHSLGCVLTVGLIRNTLHVYTNFAVFFFLALAPIFLAVLFQQSRFPQPVPVRASFRDTWRQFRAPSSILFVLLVVIQFANEYTVAGWLPLYLIRRLGVSPITALQLLSLFWWMLLLGRILSQYLLRTVRHGRLMMGSLAAALLGSVILLNTNNVSGASVSIILLGGSFAVIYPLVVERIEGRFPAHHPEFFQNIFTAGLAAGLLGPAFAGFFVATWDIQWVMVLPLIGIILVFLLVAIIWAESRLTAPPVASEVTD